MQTSKELFYAWDEIAADLLKSDFFPSLIQTIEQAHAGSYVLGNLKRSSEMIKGIRCIMHFDRGQGWGWRPVHPRTGTFPSGGKHHFAEQSFRLAMHGAGIQYSLEEAEALDADDSMLPNVLADKMRGPTEGAPAYLLMQLWTSESGVLLQASASESSLVVTCDNAGLWNTISGDRVKYCQPGMYLQWYRGSAKVGGPVEVLDVDEDNNQVLLAESRGIVDNDFAVLTTPDGLEDTYCPDVTSALTDPDQQPANPGIYDVIDSDNVFQACDRSSAANRWARAVVTSCSSAAPSVSGMRTHFSKLRHPAKAVTHPDVIDYFFDQLVRARVRFQDRSFAQLAEMSYPSIKIGQTTIVGTPDCLRDSIDVIDFDNVQIAQKRDITDPFGRGWYPLDKSTVAVRDFCWWFRLIGKRTNKCGRYHGFVMSSNMADCTMWTNPS